MDAATIAAILQKSGGQDTPENVNRIRSHYASDPQAAERRAFGLQGQSDESGGSRDAILDAMITKVMTQTDAQPQAIQQEPLAPLPMVQNASGPTRKSATAAPIRNDNRGISSPHTGDPLRDAVNDYTPANPSPQGAPVNKSGGFGIGDLVALIMGGAATAKAFSGPSTRTLRPPIAQTPQAPGNPNLPQGGIAQRQAGGYAKLAAESSNAPMDGGYAKYQADGFSKLAKEKASEKPNESKPAAPKKASKQTPEEVAKMKSEVADERAGSERMQEEMARQARAQREASALVKAARRATGRK